MQKDIHPAYKAVKVNCSCGNAFEVGSTYGKAEMSVDVCSKCHPFYTGKQKVVASDRVQRFKDKYGKKGGDAKEAASA